MQYEKCCTFNQDDRVTSTTIAALCGTAVAQQYHGNSSWQPWICGPFWMQLSRMEKKVIELCTATLSPRGLELLTEIDYVIDSLHPKVWLRHPRSILVSTFLGQTATTKGSKRKKNIWRIELFVVVWSLEDLTSISDNLIADLSNPEHTVGLLDSQCLQSKHLAPRFQRTNQYLVLPVPLSNATKPPSDGRADHRPLPLALPGQE
jgi:hypothetical protein